MNFVVFGINQGVSNISFRTEFKITSNNSAFSTMISCLVLPKITENLPTYSFESENLNIPQNLRLADPTYNKSSKIDILLGASLFWKLLCIGQIDLGKNLPTLQNTRLGWVISGNIPIQQLSSSMHTSVSCFSGNISNSLEEQVSKFWELEECNNSVNKYSKEEQQVESHFINTHKRDADGRFVVSIPLKENVGLLGESRATALKRFYNMEKRLTRDSNLRTEYAKFMEEYESMGHMSKINERDLGDSNPTYYLPHHAVIKPTSVTTKLRVVFDGSCKTSSGLSLNDVQMVGPTIQNDLFITILNFRRHFIALTGDIAKMYRQVQISEKDRALHRIFWRKDPNEELNCYNLKTVTYGTASASFLSVRCLKQLAIENKEKYSSASQIIERDFYVDDLLTGADSIEEAKNIIRDVSYVLSTGGFPLRKWLSNKPDVFENVEVGKEDYRLLQFCNHDHETKTLGILWDSGDDTFQYSINDLNSSSRVTKRTILSITAQIFDPLGLLGPIIIVAKLIIQKLWQQKLSWDESIPLDLNTRWLNFRDQLSDLNALKIPRHVLLKNSVVIELHGFADASELAYAACVYVRCLDNIGNRSVNLLCAKSRVAPLKKVNLPRLELCAAVLLANLCKKIRDSVDIPFRNFFYWSDSTITLGWINGPPQRWKTFVANRVSEIQNHTEISDWHHVRSAFNPADILSRGASPKVLLNSQLWWQGPSWLKNDISEWPIEKTSIDETHLPEAKNISTSHFCQTDDFDLFSKFSSLIKLKRVFCYVLRFISCLKQKTKICKNISPSELNESLLVLIKIAQKQAFHREIANLKAHKAVSKSKILDLNPFLDEQGIIRVGGRLENSDFDYCKKHPIVLPSHHALTNLIARNEHLRLSHCGPLHLLASLRERYWPISGRNLARKIVHDCVTCYKVKPKCFKPFMAPLPRERTMSIHPFCHSGVDYAGPCFIKDKKTRGYKTIKCYIALFVCFSTRAIHLELVSDLTSDNFLAAFRRFIARRGIPQAMYSDNGTNFVAANSKLKELFTFLKNENTNKILSDALSKEGISWSFIPPRSPHFGGLWEAGVKSAKTHLRRIIGNALLTFEEFYTILVQVEGILNSRPISPLSPDPGDLEPLTPAHFLIGRKVTTIPDPDMTHIAENRLSIFQRQQVIIQHFWKRWHREYIVELQTRSKWKEPSHHLLKLGTLVIIQEDNLPPSKWLLGRICDLHPGPDGVVRVVTIQCASAKIKRAVARICVLPMNDK